MRTRTPYISIFVILILLPAARTGACRTLVVDQSHPQARDNAAGTDDDPFLHVNAASQEAQPGDVVLVKPGTYRERVTPPRGGTSDSQRITYRAEVPGEAVISGLAVWKTNWTQVEGTVYRASPDASMFTDPYHVDGPNPYAIGMDHELQYCLGHLVVDGEMWQEYGSLDEVRENEKS